MTTISDWGTAVWTSLTNALGMIFSFIPKLLGFLIIFLVGWLLARGLQKTIVWLLQRANFEAFSERVGLPRLEERTGVRMNIIDILGKIVFWFAFLTFLIPAVDTLGLTNVSSLLGQIIGYIPNVFVAILVLFLGTLVATFVGDLLRSVLASADVGNPNLFGNIARFAIIGFAAIIALYQLNIASAIVQTLFTAIIGAVALAVGLAFGLGGRDTAQRWLDRGETGLTGVASQLTEQRRLNQSRPITEQSRIGTPSQTAAAMPTDDQLHRRTFS
jgi:hypothetical protein